MSIANFIHTIIYNAVTFIYFMYWLLRNQNFNASHMERNSPLAAIFKIVKSSLSQHCVGLESMAAVTLVVQTLI